MYGLVYLDPDRKRRTAMSAVTTNAHTPRRNTARRALSAGVLVTCFIVMGAMPPAHATIQEEECIYPDVEYPMPCEDDED